LVGVFVNAEEKEIVEIAKQIPLDAIQLHGDEDASIVDGLRYAIPDDTQLIRAVRTQSDEFSIPAMKAEINRWSNAGVDMLLLDAAEPGTYGGTGKRLDWNRVSQITFPIPWVLAGGLTANNVAEAIKQTKPDGVDVASGVEKSPGIKSESDVESFLNNARKAFAAEA
jgi:phosphoribosylanthranilate isomerase